MNVERLYQSVYAKTIVGLFTKSYQFQFEFYNCSECKPAPKMKTAILLCTVLVTTMAKPNGFYHQEYNYKTSASSYKNNELQHQNDDEGYYSKAGDLEGRVRPRVNSHSQHSEYVNPKLQYGDQMGTDRTSSFGQLHAQDQLRTRDAGFDHAQMGAGMGYRQGYGGVQQGYGGVQQGYGGMRQDYGAVRQDYGVTSDLRQVTVRLQAEMERELQRAVFEQHQRAAAYGGAISQAQIEADRRVLEEELRRNMTMRLQEALKTQYGNQGVRGAFSYSITNGRLQPTANYDNQELADLSRQLEQNLIRQLEQQVQTQYHTRVDTQVHTQRNTYGRVNNVNDNYPSPLQQRPVVYHPYPQPQPHQPHPVAPIPDSITTVATRVQTELNEILNKILEDTQRRYFSENSYQSGVNYEHVLAQLQDELRANITFHFDEEIKRAYGYSNYASQRYSMEDIANLRRQIETNLATKLSRDFNRQREKFFQSRQIYVARPVPENRVFYPSNNMDHRGIAQMQSQLQEQLSRQLQTAIMEHSYRQAHSYRGGASNVNPQANYQATLEQLSAELNRNLTRQLELLNTQQYQSDAYAGQLANMRSQLQQDLNRQLQQGLQQSYSRYSSWSSSSSSSNSNYRPVRGFDANLYNAYGGSNVGDDCMMGDDPSVYQQETDEGLTQQTEDLTQEARDLTQQVQTHDDLTQQAQDLTQQAQDLTHDDLTQQAQDLTHDDLTQQAQDLTHDDLTQQTQDEDLTQQIQTHDDLTQQTQDRDLTQQVQTQDLTRDNLRPQRTQYFSREGPSVYQKPPQNPDPTHQYSQTQSYSQQRPQLAHPGYGNRPARYEDLTQQSQTVGGLSQQTQQPRTYSQAVNSRPAIQQYRIYPVYMELPPKTEAIRIQDPTQPQTQYSPPVHEAIQQAQDQDLTQQTQDLTQQTQDQPHIQTGPAVYQEPVPTIHSVQYIPETQQVDNVEPPFQAQTVRPLGASQVQTFDQPSRYQPYRAHQVQDLTQQTQNVETPYQRERTFAQTSPNVYRSNPEIPQYTSTYAWQPQRQSEINRVRERVRHYENLDQQRYQRYQQSSRRYKPSSLYSPQQNQIGQQTDNSDLTQQTLIGQQTDNSDLTQQTQNLLGQKTENDDLTQQIQDPGFGNLQIGNQQSQQHQQTQQNTQQIDDNGFAPLQLGRNPQTQQTPNSNYRSIYQPTQQKPGQVEDLTQQEPNSDNRSIYKPTPQKPGQVEDLTQQIQQVEDKDFTQLTQQQAQVLTGQQNQDLTQQTEDLTQQTQDLTQQNQDLTQQTQDLTDENYLTQQNQDLTQQTQDLTDENYLTQHNQDLTQQTQDLTDENYLTQQNQDLTQQTQDLTQQTQDLTHQNEHLTQQNQDLTQQTQDLTDEHYLTQQNQDLTQQTQDLTDEHYLSQQNQDLTQQSQDLTQQTEDLTQQTEDINQPIEPQQIIRDQESQQLAQQTQDLIRNEIGQNQEYVEEGTTVTSFLQQSTTEDSTQQLNQAQQESQRLLDLLKGKSGQNKYSSGPHDDYYSQGGTYGQIPEHAQDTQEPEPIQPLYYQPRPVYAGQQQVGTTRQLPSAVNYASTDVGPPDHIETVKDIEPIEPQVASEVEQVGGPTEPEEAEVTTKKPGFWSRLGTSIKNKVG